MDPLESLRVQKVIIQDGSIQIHKICGKKQDAFYPYSSISVKLLYRVACFFWCWLKSVHIKKTVTRSSFLSKLWYFSIQHQLTSKQSQLMLYWKVPQFWKKWGSCNCVLKWTDFKIVSSRVKKAKHAGSIKKYLYTKYFCFVFLHDLLFLPWRPLEYDIIEVCEPFC